jgi:hypothetical protein
MRTSSSLARSGSPRAKAMTASLSWVSHAVGVCARSELSQLVEIALRGVDIPPMELDVPEVVKLDGDHPLVADASIEGKACFELPRRSIVVAEHPDGLGMRVERALRHRRRKRTGVVESPRGQVARTCEIAVERRGPAQSEVSKSQGVGLIDGLCCRERLLAPAPQILLGALPKRKDSVAVERERASSSLVTLSTREHRRQEFAPALDVARDHPESPDACGQLGRGLLVTALDEDASRRDERVLLRDERLDPEVLVGPNRAAQRGWVSPLGLTRQPEQALEVGWAQLPSSLTHEATGSSSATSTAPAMRPASRASKRPAPISSVEAAPAATALRNASSIGFSV